MKAMRLRHPAGIDNLRLEDVPDPGDPGPGQIRVRIRASSLNYHDYVVVVGGIPTPDGRIPMSDGAGEVVAVGPGVDEFAVGDSVVSVFFPNWLDGAPVPGGFRGVPGDGADGYAVEEVVAPAHHFTRAPRGWSPAEAATLTCAALTAWRALVTEGRFKAGDTVLVQGTGGVSVFALQFAKAMGATVIATSSSEAKLERLKALGADHVLNYRTTPGWGAKAAELAGGGVDHVVEVGGPGTLPESITAVRVGGHISLIGVLTGYAGPVPTVQLMAKQVRLIGITVGTRRDQLDMIRAVEATGLRPVIDRHFPLAELGAAFRHQESGAHFGKIVVDI
ncbi:MAG: NAD(P)-dependent alcohol dehydrogenase [Sphingomonadaceae bacterium]|uniref:zinc-dependent alcohol dehydrogenase family protein n=1 Tax=Thermaurantiacus sp. TaxID=2820283 RepID=UPI00298EF1F3|nr:NAD(P)-dependent alcohol dehydrogenase [Thermaurantiacus sp.]MCS6987028.1 NAD(P)-dependent alcohol dehydrogenase [Sphingomonadaceae bacterium]MDW8415634.1 NAD(P)-dependent alcohol dehydrogenase [Thermaurantiacus sp.]